MKHALLSEMLHEQWLGGRLHYWPAFLNAEVAGKLYRQLRHSLPWRQDSIRLYGRRLSLPRLQCWFGPRAYRYSGLVLPACPLPAPLQGLIKEVSHQCGHDFNAVLVILTRQHNISYSAPQASSLSRRVPQARVAPLARHATPGGEMPEAPVSLI